MIIPIKCFSCGKVLADKYLYYIKTINEKKMKNGESGDEVVYLTKDNIEKTVEGEVLDYLGLNSKQIQLYNLIIHKQCWDKIHYQYFSKNDKKYIKLLMLIFQKINKSYVLELILTTIITRDFFYI